MLAMIDDKILDLALAFIIPLMLLIALLPNKRRM